MNHSFTIEGFNIMAYRGQLQQLEARFSNFWGSITYPARIISTTRKFSFIEKRQALRQQINPLDDLRELATVLETQNQTAIEAHINLRREALQRAFINDHQKTASNLLTSHLDTQTIHQITKYTYTALWRWRWLKNYRRLYELLEETAPPLGINHYFHCWPNESSDPDVMSSVLKEIFLLGRVITKPMPALFTGEYLPELTYLRPTQQGQPFLRVMHAYDVRGEWDLATFNDLLNTDNEIAIAIDIDTLGRGTAQRKTQDAHTILTQAIYGKNAVKDARSERALRDVNYTMQRLDQQNLHEVAYFFLLQAPSVRALDKQTQAIKDKLGVRMRLDVLAGSQHQYLKIFTNTPTKDIDAHIPRKNSLSENIASKIPWGIKKNSNTDGIIWGEDIFEKMPIHYNLFGDNGTDNGHFLMLGQSGSGKTVALSTLALRLAVEGCQVVYFDPVGKVQWLAEAVGKGASYQEVSTSAAVNILDPISSDITTQIAHVTRKLAVILGRVIPDGERVAYTPRDLNNFEIGALDLALQHPKIYGENGANLKTMNSENAPLLEQLAEVLKTVEVEEAPRLAEEIRLKVTGSQGKIYNRKTTLSWDFKADVCCYNWLKADKALLPVYYDHAFATLDAYVRSEERKKRKQPLVVIIDEYGFMSQIKALQSFVAMATKTWRNYNAAMGTCDQNAATYMGGEGGTAAQFAAYTTNNTALKFFGRQQGSDVQLLREAFNYLLSEGDLQRLLTSTEGQFIAIFNNQVQRLKIELTGDEKTYFIRSNK